MNIEALLQERGLKKSELAKMMDVNRQNINSLLNNPTLTTIEKIANALGVETWELFKSKEDMNSNTIICPKCGARFKLEEESAND